MLSGSRGGCLHTTAWSDSRRHESRPRAQPRRISGSRHAFVGSERRLRAGAEPGVRLPVSDGSVFLVWKHGGTALLGDTAIVVGTDLRGRLPRSRQIVFHAWNRHIYGADHWWLRLCSVPSGPLRYRTKFD